MRSRPLFHILPVSILLLAICSSTSAYSQPKEQGIKKLSPVLIPKNKNVTISGNVKMLEKQPPLISVYSFQYDDMVTGERIVIPISQDSSGNFTVTFPIDIPQEMKLVRAFGMNSQINMEGPSYLSFFMRPGNDLDLTYFLSADYKVNWELKGRDSQLNLYYQLYQEAVAQSAYGKSLYADLQDTSAMSKTGYKEHVRKQLEAGYAFNQAYFKTHPGDPFIKDQIKYNAQYEAVNSLVLAVNKGKLKDTALFAFMKAQQIAVNNPGAYGNEKYRTFVDQYYLVIAGQARYPKQQLILSADLATFILSNYPELSSNDRALCRKMTDVKKYKPTDQEINHFYEDFMGRFHNEYLAAQKNNIPEFDYLIKYKDPFIRDLYATKTLYKQIKINQVDYIKPNLEVYKAIVRPGPLKNKFLADYQWQIRASKNSRLIDNYHLHAISASTTYDALKEISTKYRGKVVYLDVWATWCSSCLAGMPAAAKLRKKMVGRDVVFAYLCINSPTEKTWKNAIVARDIDGENYFLNYEQSRKLNGQVNLKSIPRYIIIDQEGKISAQDAGDPGDPKVVEHLQQLLERP